MTTAAKMREKGLESIMVYVPIPLKRAFFSKARAQGLNAREIIIHWITKYTGYKAEEPVDKTGPENA